MIWRTGVLLPLLGGCALLTGETDTDTDPPPPVTARLVADAWIQDCRWNEEDWLGVESLTITLHHRLPELPEQTLPAPGTCVTGLELFAEEAVPRGDDLPGLDGRPRYDSPEASGQLAPLTPGLWHSSAFVAPERCGTLDESVGPGVSLTDAGVLTGLGTPATGTWTTAAVDGGRFIDASPVSLGQTATLTWDAQEWDSAFVQIRREHEGEVREVITCGAQGGSFTLDDTAWSQANAALLADDNRVVLGLVRQELVETVDGSARAWMVLRALHTIAPD